MCHCEHLTEAVVTQYMDKKQRKMSPAAVKKDSQQSELQHEAQQFFK